MRQYGDSRGTTEELDNYDERTELPNNIYSNRMSPIVGFSSRDEREEHFDKANVTLGSFGTNVAGPKAR